MNKKLIGVLTGLGFALSASMAQATAIYLVGAQLYSANSSGSNVEPGYQYSTNSAPDGFQAFLPLDLQSDGSGISESSIAFGLNVGDNVFDFRPVEDRFGNFPRSYYGLNLFFNDTGVSFNPMRSAPAIAGDLTVAVQTDQSSFFVPAAGTSIQAYNASAGASPLFYRDNALANGNALINVGGYDVNVTAFSENGAISCGNPGCIGGNPDPSGSFAINVAPASVPEPATLALLSLGLAGFGFARKRMAS